MDTNLDRLGPMVALAPCGPECRFANALPAALGEFIWCDRLGGPRSTGYNAVECPYFSPRSSRPIAVTETPATRPRES